jgi:two-component system chemotaxis sensor kinase CheA
MAQTMGFDAMGTIAHRIEDLMTGPKAAGEISQKLVDFLFVVADFLSSSVQAIRDKKPLPSGQAILENCASLAKGEEVEITGAEKAAKEISEIRVKMEKLDKLFNLTNELLISRSRLLKLSQEIGNGEMISVGETTSRLISVLQDEVMRLRMLPLSTVFEFFPRWLRDEAKRQNKEIDFQIQGGEIEVDRSIIDVIKEPIMHLLRNALDHGIVKKGKITLGAVREKELIMIAIGDNGKGIDIEEVRRLAAERRIVDPAIARSMSREDLLKILLNPNFSTKQDVSELSGRGIGLDIVNSTVTDLGGRLEISSEKGKGSTFTIELPISLAIIRAMIFALDGQRFALPLNFIQESFYIEENAVRTVFHRELIPLRDEILPLLRIGDMLNCRGKPGRKCVVVVRYHGIQRGFVTDEILSEEEVVVKKIDPLLPGAIYSGCSIFADGQPILILDPRGFE